jgi:hypothetical protein
MERAFFFSLKTFVDKIFAAPQEIAFDPSELTLI